MNLLPLSLESLPPLCRARLMIKIAIVVACCGLCSSVFATSDTTAPQLVSVDFTPKSVDVSNGSQVVTVTAHLTDTGSTCPICGNTGVNYAGFYFYSPSGNQSVWRLFDSSNRVSGTAQDGIYQTTMTIPKVSESGNWTMNFAYVYDLLGNYTQLQRSDMGVLHRILPARPRHWRSPAPLRTRRLRN